MAARDPNATNGGSSPSRAVDQELVRSSPSSLSPLNVAGIVALIGVLLTVFVAWGAYFLNNRNEHRLLQLQTRQVEAVLAATVLSITNPLSTALQVAIATDGNVQQFRRQIAGVARRNGVFVSAALVRTTGTASTVITSVGAPTWLDLTASEGQALVHRAAHSSTFLVVSLRHGISERIGYAVSSPVDPQFVVYAERAIPPDREAPIEKDSAFSDLNYATYVGTATTAQNLATTDVPPSDLPLSGYVARAAVPFGDTEITLVATARGDLGGTFGAALPWVLLPGGLLLTVGAALLSEQLARRRRRAELHAETITALYGELDGLYAQQRTVAVALQRALLPASHPQIPGLEIASRYVAGVRGVDIGGDWYSVVELPERRFGFVVGDVSGRGVSAATVMARIRFTIRAYLVEGHGPAEVLTMCNQQIDLERDGHFATALVGVGDITTGQVVLANAGHLNPLLVVDGHAEFVPTTVGLPLGTGAGPYETTTVNLPPGGVLLGYTDGLVERRGEHLDAGLNRLATATMSATQATLDETLAGLIAALAQDGAEDDVAIIALQRTPADQ